jgi:hypothetical protein
MKTTCAKNVLRDDTTRSEFIRRADVMSLYSQGDVNAGATGAVVGRPGDVRIDSGVFDDNGTVRAVAIGLYPKWYGPGTAVPTTQKDNS